MVEVLVCLLLLGVVCVVASAYGPVSRSAAALEVEVAALNHARAKMAELEAGPLVTLAGADSISVGGASGGAALRRVWWVAPCDLDGDTVAEADAFRLHVEMEGVTLETIRTDPPGLEILRR
jgi:hypothetical protein